MTYVTMREDKFGSLRSRIKELSAEVQAKTQAVRRPLHGMELPEDAYATITIRSARGDALEVLANTSADGGSVYGETSTTNLIVQKIDESRQEKQQIIETFGEDFVYYYGQRPRMLQVSAVLPDSLEFQYAQEFWTNYDRALRGTRLVTRDARVFLDVAGQVFEGYLSSAQTSRSADQPRIINLSFTMYITHSYYIRPLENGKVAGSPDGANGQAFMTYTSSMLGDYLKLPSPEQNISQSVDVFMSDAEIPNRTLLTLLRAKGSEVKVYDFMNLDDPYKSPSMSFAMPEVGDSTFGARSVPESTLSKALSGASTVLSVVAGGFIAAGAVGAVVDGVNAEGGALSYFNNRILNPVVDEIDVFLNDSGDILKGLVDAGYSIVEPDKPLSESEFFTTEELSSEESSEAGAPSPLAVSDPEVLIFIEEPALSSAPRARDIDVMTFRSDDTFIDRVIL